MIKLSWAHTASNYSSRWYWPAAILLATSLCLLSALKYFTLHSGLYDLGIFERIAGDFYITGNTRQIFLGHSHFWGLAIYDIATALEVQHVGYVLLIVQGLLLAIPLIPIGRHFGKVAAIAYGLYAPVWLNAHFDFHFDHLAVPLLLAFYLAVKAEKPYIAMGMGLLLMGIKEPFALQAAACGFFLIWTGFQFQNPQERDHETHAADQKWAFFVSGSALVFAAGGYFYIATHYVIPYFLGNAHVAMGGGAFSWMGQNLRDMVIFLLTQPFEIFREILTTPGKLLYLLIVFGLLAFIPLLAPSYLIPAIPLIAIAMLSRLTNYYDYNTHYTAGLIIPVMFAFIHGLPKAHALWIKAGQSVWRKLSTLNLLQQGTGIAIESKLLKMFHALLALWILAGHVAVSPSPISRLFWSEKIWSYSWHTYVPTTRESMMKEAILSYIPEDRDVSVTTQNTVNWYHLAQHKVYTPFPEGITEPIKVMDWSSRTWEGLWRFIKTGQMSPAVTYDRYADYVVLDLKRPWYLMDKGCEWVYGHCQDQEMAGKFLVWVERARDLYNVVFEQDGFMILQRKN